jgi:chromosome segregation ATPase
MYLLFFQDLKSERESNAKAQEELRNVKREFTKVNNQHEDLAREKDVLQTKVPNLQI